MIKLRIKTKISLGLCFLFVVIIVIGSMGAIYIHRIAGESKEVLKDNYESIEYARLMLQLADNINDPASRQAFYQYLARQEHNITEPGEKELTVALRTEIEAFEKKAAPALQQQVRQSLYRIMDLNMQAIVRKSRQAQASADDVLSYIGLIGGICFLVVIVFMVNFPGYIANPIREMTESIRQIAGKNYKRRLHFKSNDEFGELAEAFNTMAGELDQYENSNLARIMFEKKRIDTIINNMKDAIVGLNEKKIILFANKEATQLLGLSEKDIIGRPAQEVALQNDLMQMLITPVHTKQPIKIFADHKESYFTKDIIAVTSGEEPIGEVILLRNVTYFQELDLAKTNLIATISHELKTPIASIKLSAKLLHDDRVGGLNPEQQQLINHIEEDSERLLKITAEVLNMAQVETGKIQIRQQLTDPWQVVDYAVNATKLQASQRGIRIDASYSESLPQLYIDPDKTAWVMVNLIGNAIRYSPENSQVFIRVSATQSLVSFTVRDTGAGISAGYQDKIFDKYFRAPSSRQDGAGLGLAISKDFIEAQGGAIWVKSSPGEGSTFGFDFSIPATQ